MSHANEDPFDVPAPAPPADPLAFATGKGDIHIAGAGKLGMILLIASLSMLFIASVAAYLLIRFKTTYWPPPGFPPIPQSLWVSTVVILLSSFTMQSARNAIRRGLERKLTTMLIVTAVLGVLFLAMQIVNWLEFYSQIPANASIQGAYLGMFYVLTGLHGAHVIGGLIPMAILLPRALRGRYSANYHPGVRYLNVYWHFLDIVWLALFAVLYF